MKRLLAAKDSLVLAEHTRRNLKLCFDVTIDISSLKPGILTVVRYRVCHVRVVHAAMVAKQRCPMAPTVT